MKKNPDAAMRRKERRKEKNKKQGKIMMIIGIIAAALVVAIIAIWAFTGIRTVMNKDLSTKEMQDLFRSEKNIPAQDDPMLGSWYFYHNGAIIGKYDLNSDGKMLVYDWDEEDYKINSMADYRVRPKAGKLYVKPEESGKIVVYDYTLEQDKDREDVYMMSWTHEYETWKLVKIVME